MNLEDRILLTFAVSVFCGAMALGAVAVIEVITSVIG